MKAGRNIVDALIDVQRSARSAKLAHDEKDQVTLARDLGHVVKSLKDLPRMLGEQLSQIENSLNAADSYIDRKQSEFVRQDRQVQALKAQNALLRKRLEAFEAPLDEA